MNRYPLPKYLIGLLIFTVLAVIFFGLAGKTPAKMKLGVSFSPRYAGYLKLDWQNIYMDMLDDLQVKNLRVPTYWDVLEPQSAKYEFNQTDFMLEEAAKRGAGVILVLGERQPRWPECHIPEWARELTSAERRGNLLQFVETVVRRYKDRPEIWAWQVENEPLLNSFGEGCDSPDESFLKREVALVRNLSQKTIILTDSGELGSWILPQQLSDLFGTTLYRRVYDKTFGYITYPLPPVFYSAKSNLVRAVFAPQNQKTIIVELQAEPWLAGGKLISPDEQAKQFSINDFQDYLRFAGETGFEEAYLWGVEWWYFMAANGHPEYLDYAKTLFN